MRQFASLGLISEAAPDTEAQLCNIDGEAGGEPWTGGSNAGRRGTVGEGWMRTSSERKLSQLDS